MQIGARTGAWKASGGPIPPTPAIGIYVAVGNKNISHSTDGYEWDSISPLTRSARGICYAQGKFIIPCTQGYILKSTDSYSWTEQNLGTTLALDGGICHGDNGFVISARNGFYHSYDGDSWTLSGLSTGETYCNTICYGDGKYIASSGSKVWYSTDGISWNYKEMSQSGFGTPCFCYGNGMFLCSGGNSYVISSSNGIEWSEPIFVHDNRQPITRLNGCVYNNGKFYTGSGKYLYVSTDLTNWELLYYPESSDVDSTQSLSCCNGKIIAGSKANYSYLYVFNEPPTTTKVSIDTYTGTVKIWYQVIYA